MAIDLMARMLASGGGNTYTKAEINEMFDDVYTKEETEAYTTAEKEKLASITNPIVIKGKVDTVEDLPNNPEIGWLYFVGEDDAENFDEYVYTEDGWEIIGNSNVDLSAYLTEVQSDAKYVQRSKEVFCTQAEYDEMVTHDVDTKYFCS